MHNTTKHKKNIFGQIVYNALAVKKYCQKFFLEVNGKQSAKMPKKGCNVQIGKYHKQLPSMFVNYTDLKFSA